MTSASAKAAFIWRRYHVAGQPEREVVLAIGTPRPDLGGWACRIVLCDGTGRVLGSPTDSFGADPLQAVQLALSDARRTLDAFEPRLQWDGGPPGDVGIPMSVPTDFGFKVQRQLERMLKKESRQRYADVDRRRREWEAAHPETACRAPKKTKAPKG